MILSDIITLILSSSVTSGQCHSVLRALRTLSVLSVLRTLGAKESLSIVIQNVLCCLTYLDVDIRE